MSSISSRSTGEDSVGAIACAYMDRLEAAMRSARVWPGEPPAEPIEVQGAFGCENMPFEHWLAWVLVPNVRKLVESGSPLPPSSAVAGYGVRALDGAPCYEDLMSVLREFDEFVNTAA